MQVQVNTDDNIPGRDALTRKVQDEVAFTLGRLERHLTRLEIHLGDENAAKSGGEDKRCMIEARPNGQQPIAVTHYAATLDEAWSGAARKLKNLLESKFDRLNDLKGSASIRDNDLR